MEIVTGYTDRHNKALDLYRTKQEERQKRFCAAYEKWVKIPDDLIWWFKARQEAWEEYLLARREWTGL